MFSSSPFERTRSFRIVTLALAAVVLCALPSEAKIRTSSHTSSAAPTSKSRGKSHAKTSGKRSGAHSKKVTRKGAWKRKGQQGIQEERATQIQQALIREHYLDGEANGAWDSKTQDAMRKYQADNGWQTKVVPDSRAIIKLGLGPTNDGLINPENAATASAARVVQASSPAPAGAAPLTNRQ